MPIIIEDEKKLYLYTGKIAHMFRNCPKPDGWFGCYFKADGVDNDIKLTGTYPKYQLNDLKDKNAKFNVLLQGTNDPNAFTIKDIQLIPSAKHISKILKSIKGVGPQTIAKILKHFGADTYRVVTKETYRLLDIGIANVKVKLIEEAFSNDVIKAKLEILKLAPDLKLKQVEELLECSNEVNLKAAVTCIKDIIINRPYFLLSHFSSVKLTFVTVDKIAMANGFAFDSDERLYAAFYYAMYKQFEKSVYISLAHDSYKFLNAVTEILNLNSSKYISIQYVESNFNRIMKNMQSKDYSLIVDGDCLYTRSHYEAETEAALKIATLIQSEPIYDISESDIEDAIDEFEINENRTLDEYQRAAVVTALTNRIAIVDGGPGRGKSSVAKCIIYVFETYTKCHVNLIAPTGKACNRLNEATNRLDAHTVMSNICKYDFAIKSKSKQSREFLNMFDETLVIIDETSMIGLSDANKLLSICENCNVIFMGDVNQLSSIQYGQFFKDICDNEDIPRATLIINHRATGLIVDNAEAYNRGVHVENCPLTVGNDKTFQFYNFDGISDITNSEYVINDYVNSVLQNVNGDFNALWYNMIQTCILCPINGGPAGVQNLNLQIQARLNQNGRPIDELKYTKKNLTIVPRVGDRIVFTKNDSKAEYEYVFGENKRETGEGICNGDCGIIKTYDDSDVDCEPTIIFITDDGRRYEINISSCNLELGYALTIHKSQGSEYNNVILSFPSTLLHVPVDFACRNLLYTAITRAKFTFKLYGSLLSANRCIDNPSPIRYSNLSQRISEHFVYDEY